MATVFLWLALGAPVCGDFHEGFEGGKPKLLTIDNDCGARLVQQEISADLPRSGQTCELIDIACQQGTMAIMGYPIEPVETIEELRVSLWLRSAQRGMRLGLRVVYPNALHPVTGKEHSIWIWGDAYTQTKTWQRLEVKEIKRQLSLQTQIMRGQFGANWDWDTCYIDTIGLNLYSGVGRTRLQIDDVEILGDVPYAQRLANQMQGETPGQSLGRLASGTGSNLGESRALPTISQGGEMAQTLSLAPRWIQYQGESMELLASMGFTGVILTRVPTSSELQQAAQSGMRLICPAPTIAPLELDWKAWEPVEAWFVGGALDTRAIDAIRREADRVRRFPPAMQRPVVGEPVEQFWSYSRVCQALMLPCPAPASSASSTELTRFLKQARDQCRGELPTWASISTQPLIEWDRQINAARQALGIQDSGLVEGDPLQIRFQVYRALAGGLRGIHFRSRSPLDSANLNDQTRSSMLQWINAELELLRPWLGGGALQGSVTTNHTSMDGALWQTPRSQLIVLQPSEPDAHLSWAPFPAQSIKVNFQPISPSAQLFRVTHWKLEQIQPLRVPGGMEFVIEKPRAIEFIVATTDSQVSQYLVDRFRGLGSNLAVAQATIAQQRIALAHQIIAARWEAQSSNTFTQDLQIAQRAARDLEAGHAFIGSDLSVMVQSANNAMEMVQSSIHRAWLSARNDLLSPQSSPMVLASSSLPMHWHLGKAIGTQPWQPLALAGGDFEAIDQLLSGWTQDRRLEDQAEMLVEIAPHSDPTNGGALRLAAKAKTDGVLSGGYAGATLRIGSPFVDVAKGNVVRIEGLVKVRQVFQQPQAGLLIYDSQAGPSLGNLTSDTGGQWKPFRIYRTVVADDPLQIVMELRGEGDVMVDNLVISYVTPLPAEVNAAGLPTYTPSSFPPQ